MTDPVQPSGARAKWIALAAVAVGLFIAARTLPLDRWIEDLNAWVEGFGAFGVVVFVAIYVLAALLFVPGSALTIAAGAVFGLWWGTAAVSLASTTAAALAFLIARYLARDAIAARAGQNPKFEAIDRAIGAKGWKIVALLRLSPAMPFSLGNYLYGLTAVRFGPYVLASWLAMLPGTFMYVYLGHIGAEGLQAASGDSPADTGRLVLLGVGLAATVIVTVYVTVLALRAIREQTDIAAS
jgi:uncharacterized membrane protein YdjX (TVP38/TMEM64 family)